MNRPAPHTPPDTRKVSCPDPGKRTARWSSRSLGSRPQHEIFYALIRATGWRGAYALLFFVILWYTLRPSVRARGAAYLGRRFPRAGKAALLLHAWRLQWSFGKVLVDRAAAGITGVFSFAGDMRDALLSLAKEGNGVIMLSAHAGCWQMAPLVLARHAGLPVTVLAHKDRLDVDRQSFEHAGEAPPFDSIGPEGGPLVAVELMKRLRRGQLVCMMGDRSMGNADPVLEVPFLGDSVPFPYLAYRLASATGAPVAVFFALRSGPCRGGLALADVLRVPKGLGGAPEAYRPFARRFAEALEDFTRTHPYQFFNFFDMWKR